jgi:hypothetical protein
MAAFSPGADIFALVRVKPDYEFTPYGAGEVLRIGGAAVRTLQLGSRLIKSTIR